MSNIEHLIENAITSIEENKTYEDWRSDWRQKAMLKEVMSDAWEIWQMAQYCYYTYRQDIIWKTEDEIEKRYGYPIPEGE